MSFQAMAWLGLLVLFLILELVTTALVSVWFVGGSLAAFISTFATDKIWIQIVVFLVASAILLFSMRPLAIRLTGKNLGQSVAGAQSLIGKRGIVTAEINNLKAEGEVQVSGQVWSARSLNEKELLGKGQVVIIRKIDGVKLLVEKEA